MNEKIRPRRHDILPKIMRAASEPSVIDSALQARAKWMAEESNFSKYLLPEMSFELDPNKEDLEVVKSPSVLFVGAGKGHEMIDAMDRFPESKITGIDPNDAPTKKVEQKFKDNPNVKFLSEHVRAENLQGIEDNSQDAIVLNFVLHHVDLSQYEQVMSELKRVLKDSGYLFVAEDLVDSANEQKITEIRDRIMNWEIKSAPHNYNNVEDWNNFFSKHGFSMVEVNTVKPKTVRHGFFVFRKNGDFDNENNK